MKIPKITDISKWSSWSGDTPKNLRIWKDTGTSYKPILSKIEKIKYVYHGTSLANAMKLLQTGVKSRADDGLNVTTDLGYAMTYASNAVDDDPKTIVAIVAIPTNLIDWKRAQMSDNADDEQNAQILNNIPGSKLKIIAVATSSQNLKKAPAQAQSILKKAQAQSKLQEETNNLTNLISYLFEEMQGRPDPRIHLNSPDWLTATSGQKAAHIFQRISDIWKEEAGMIETEDSEISRNWRRRAADIAELSPREIVVALEEQRKKATEFSDYMKNF